VTEFRRGSISVSATIKNNASTEAAFYIVSPRPVLIAGGVAMSSELFQSYCAQDDCRHTGRAPVRLSEGATHRVSLRFIHQAIEPSSGQKLELELPVQDVNGARSILQSQFQAP
jgi:hypothetical protein